METVMDYIYDTSICDFRFHIPGSYTTSSMQQIQTSLQIAGLCMHINQAHSTKGEANNSARIIWVHMSTFREDSQIDFFPLDISLRPLTPFRET